MPEAVELILDLSPGPESGTFAVVGKTSFDAAANGVVRLDVRSIDRRLLQSTVLASAVVARGSFSEAEEPVRETGEALFKALFNDTVRDLYAASRAVANSQGHRCVLCSTRGHRS